MASSMEVAGFTFLTARAVITPRMVPLIVDGSGGRGKGREGGVGK